MDLTVNLSEQKTSYWRKTEQPILPVRKTNGPQHEYEIYPTVLIEPGKIFNGYESLARWIVQKGFVAIDGYVGVFFDQLQQALQQEFDNLETIVRWTITTDQFKPVSSINEIVAPFIGTPGSVWGTKAKLKLEDFFRPGEPIAPSKNEVHVVIGVGASMMAPAAHLVYVDLPKNELQFRMRAGSITNLGNEVIEAPAEMYKRFYFVDWVVLNEYKKQILPKIEVIADGQWRETPNWMYGKDFIHSLRQLAKHSFRVRPWFEPGAWGGQWMKEKLDGINKDVVNYAWSFELIVPENGLVFESDGYLLETSFDFLMFSEASSVLGRFVERFGDEFPIRFDFLDTWNGGNLSIQCHPSVDYIQKQFGEKITQDETYYILDCEPDATVYLGFQESVDPTEFKKELERSRDQAVELDITKYVQSHHAKKHDLFLIPNGTVHSAGAGNLVLEISATPYIFTFKMYDWLRLDLNGEPRAINIDHAFNNLRFERKGEKVTEELISKQTITRSGQDWQIVHVPTHRDHFYDVERLEFDSSVTENTNDSCHVLMLVEGTAIKILHEDGTESVYHYAETFVVPAAAISYTLVNLGTQRAKVIKAFLKP